MATKTSFQYGSLFTLLILIQISRSSRTHHGSSQRRKKIKSEVSVISIFFSQRLYSSKQNDHLILSCWILDSFTHYWYFSAKIRFGCDAVRSQLCVFLPRTAVHAKRPRSYYVAQGTLFNNQALRQPRLIFLVTSKGGAII